MSAKRVEVLVFDGCPNVDVALGRARAAVSSANVPVDVRVVRVESEEEARRLRFLGSPTVRVDGVDIEPGAKDRDDFGLQCRVYSVGGRLEGAPPAEWIVAVLRGEEPPVGAASLRSTGCCAPTRGCR
jgi:hypothetical protein